MTTALSGTEGGNATGGNTGGGGASPGATGNTNTGQTQGGATGGQSWRDSLPADIKDDPALIAFSDVGNLAKSYIHTKAKVGAKGVVVPGEKASDQDWNQFYKEIGVPDLEKYDVPLGKDVKVPDEVLKQFKETAAKSGLLPKQAANLMDWYLKFESSQVSAKQETEKAQSQQAIESLKREMGDSFNQNIQAAQLAAKEVFGDAFVQKLKNPMFGNDPDIIRGLAKVAKMMGEDRLREGGVMNTDAQTRQEIVSQMDDIRNNGGSNGYWDAKHPNHASMVAKMESLGKQLTGGR